MGLLDGYKTSERPTTRISAPTAAALPASVQGGGLLAGYKPRMVQPTSTPVSRTKKIIKAADTYSTKLLETGSKILSIPFEKIGQGLDVATKSLQAVVPAIGKGFNVSAKDGRVKLGFGTRSDVTFKEEYGKAKDFTTFFGDLASKPIEALPGYEKQLLKIYETDNNPNATLKDKAVNLVRSLAIGLPAGLAQTAKETLSGSIFEVGTGMPFTKQQKAAQVKTQPHVIVSPKTAADAPTLTPRVIKATDVEVRKLSPIQNEAKVFNTPDGNTMQAIPTKEGAIILNKVVEGPAIKKDAPVFREKPAIQRPIKVQEDFSTPDGAAIGEAQGRVLSELKNAEAGQRIRTGEKDAFGGETWIAQKSTFPDWIPEKLRSKQLTEAVHDHILKGTTPKKANEVRLYNAVADHLDTLTQAKQQLAKDIDLDSFSFAEDKIKLSNKYDKEIAAIEKEIGDTQGKEAPLTRVEELSPELEDIAQEDWANNYADKYGEAYNKSLKLKEEIKTAPKETRPKLRAELSVAEKKALDLEQEFVNRYNPEKPTPPASTRTEPKNETQALITEARKYKSAEEFVNKKVNSYHQTDAKFTKFENTNQPFRFNNANFFLDTKPNKLTKQYLVEAQTNLKNPLRLKDSNITQPIIDRAIKDGYDGIINELPANEKFPKRNEIAVFDPNNIKTKSQLTDIWNKAQSEVSISGTPQREVISPEVRVRGLSEGVEAKAIEKKLSEGFGELPEYKVVNMKEQATAAADLLVKDPARAKRIALGTETPPEGLLPESVFVALEDKAIKTKDVPLLQELAKSELTGQATEMGQRIRSLAERDPASPVGAIREVQKAREAAIERRLKSTVKEATNKEVAQIEKEIAKTLPKKETWQSFIDSITC